LTSMISSSDIAGSFPFTQDDPALEALLTRLLGAIVYLVLPSPFL